MQIRGIGAARLVALTLLSAIFSQPVLATNGYFSHGLGLKNKAMAGAGTASPAEALAAAMNPAAGVLVDEKWEIGLAIFSPSRGYSASSSLANGMGGAFTIGAGSVSSGSEYFPIPHVGKVWKLDEVSAISFNFYGRGGMNTDYSGGSAILDPDGPPGPAPVMTLPGPFGGGKAGVDLAQAFIDVGYARQMDTLSIGISGVIAIQQFEAKGVGTFAGYTRTFATSGGTRMPANLTDNGHDTSTGLGIKLGAIWQASDVLSLAASWQSRITMAEFDHYADLFAEAGGFDIPPAIRLGASLKATPEIGLHLDYELTWFSDVDSVGNPIRNIFECPTAGAGGTDVERCLGGAKGAGFGWEDVGTVKLGVDWQYSNDLVLRAGYSIAQQPIPTSEVLFNILAPGVMEHHFTFGLSRTVAGGSEFSVMLMYAPTEKVTGANTFDPTQTITIEMSQFELEFGYRF